METLKTMVTDRKYTGIAWLLIRLFVGYQWLTAGWEKINEAAWVGDKVPAGIHGFLAGALTKTAGDHPSVFAWYGDFIKNVALPNERVLSYLVAYGEVLVGLALVVGLFSKWAAFWGLTMNLAFYLAGSTSSNGYMMVAEMAMLFGGLGVSFYGLDTIVLPFLKKEVLHLLHRDETPKPTFTPQPHPVA
jgi:thiosulfate dehydrogenase [quinone] large subunit